MLSWTIQPVSPVGPTRRFYASSRASHGGELCEDLQELWLTLFKEQLPLYPKNQWDTILGSLQIWHGTIGLGPCLGLNLFKQQPGCRLYFEALHKVWDEASPEETEEVTQEIEQLICKSLMLAFQRIASDVAVRAILDERPLRFAILTAPDRPPIFESVLR